ncbi:MAG: glutamate synthase [Ilumatobacter sp.]|nr:glutamate synthase [Ilumatobacter sp.]
MSENTTDPTIADNKPAVADLTAGEEYHWCACGRSSNQPFCDGSHVGTDFTPKAFTAETDGAAHLCACKRTGNAPYCDGSHAQITAVQVGTTGSAAAAAAATPPPSGSGAAPTARSTPEEPTVEFIHQLARDGLTKIGHHGTMTSMGVPRKDLPHWDDIQIMVAQMATKPLLDDVTVGTELVIGPEAERPLHLDIPLFVSDMSFGALSEEAKVALATGAELAGTGICSGEGGMLPEEQRANSRYFYELASAQFGYREELLSSIQAFHFKGGQGAKTGTGGHLPGSKNVGKIAEVRGIEPGHPAVSPPTFTNLHSVDDFRRFGDRVRELSGGVPIGMKLSANHVEADLGFALDSGVDYVILDGRGGGTGAAPTMFRDHISVPTIPALARARRFLDDAGASGRVTLIVTGGLRVSTDFVKALALGADGIALSNSAMQAIGCVGARMCNSNNCPTGIATQKPELRARLDVAASAQRLATFFSASVELMSVMARACGHDHLSKLNQNDLATWDDKMAKLSGVRFAGYQSVDV